MKRALIVLGAVGNCLDIVEAAQAAGDFEVQGFLDDDPAKRGTKILGLPVLGDLRAVSEYREALFVNGIGNARMFQKKAEILGRTCLPRERFATIIHPRAVVAPSAILGKGTVVLANTTICAQARIGDHVLILPNCIVGHDTVVGDYTILTSGVVLSGAIRVGASSYLGAGCVVREGLTVGERSLLGMGAVLVKNQPPGTVYAGTPARDHRRRS